MERRSSRLVRGESVKEGMKGRKEKGKGKGGFRFLSPPWETGGG